MSEVVAILGIVSVVAMGVFGRRPLRLRLWGVRLDMPSCQQRPVRKRRG